MKEKTPAKQRESFYRTERNKAQGLLLAALRRLLFGRLFCRFFGGFFSWLFGWLLLGSRFLLRGSGFLSHFLHRLLLGSRFLCRFRRRRCFGCHRWFVRGRLWESGHYRRNSGGPARLVGRSGRIRGLHVHDFLLYL